MNPGHGDDKAQLTLVPTAAYKSIQQYTGKRLSQRDLAEWLEDWAENLKVTDANGNDMNTSSAIAAVRNITIKALAESNHKEHNFGATRSALEEIEASSQAVLPGEIHFTLTPYEDLPSITIILRLSVFTSDDKPALKLRWVGEGAQREAIAQSFKQTLAGQLGDAASLTLGEFTITA